MIGLVIVTHGHLAVELQRAAEHVVGPQDNLETVCIGPDDDMERRRDEIRAAVKSVGADKGVILLTDMFGGTPSNLAISMLAPGKVEVVAGVNLPMLVSVVRARARNGLVHVAQSGLEAGRHYIGYAEAPKADSKKAAEWAGS